MVLVWREILLEVLPQSSSSSAAEAFVATDTSAWNTIVAIANTVVGLLVVHPWLWQLLIPWDSPNIISYLHARNFQEKDDEQPFVGVLLLVFAVVFAAAVVVAAAAVFVDHSCFW